MWFLAGSYQRRHNKYILLISALEKFYAIGRCQHWWGKWLCKGNVFFRALSQPGCRSVYNGFKITHRRALFLRAENAPKQRDTDWRFLPQVLHTVADFGKPFGSHMGSECGQASLGFVKKPGKLKCEARAPLWTGMLFVALLLENAVTLLTRSKLCRHRNYSIKKGWSEILGA